ncbi:MAG: hypothetical protein IPO09_20505 [Anaeromyxobacter sp.]|nr:hypothetical protein [Anaeromyxobacter sp.]MBL0274827.1 hypothetical protein [Anaeromyxobacter sp.]
MPAPRCWSWSGTCCASLQAQGDRAPLLARLDVIDQGAEAVELPLSSGDELQVLREHLALVRRRPSELGGHAGGRS